MNSHCTSETIENLLKIKTVCFNFMKNPENSDELNNLKILIDNSTPTVVRTVETQIFAIFYPLLKEIAGNTTNKVTIRVRHAMVDALTALFGKITVEKPPLFYNIYGFLLNEVYNIRNHTINNIPEEYKLSIMECTMALFQSLSNDLVCEIYVKENAPKFSQMLLITLKLAKNEQFKQLQITSLKCLMAIVRVLKDEDFNDLVIRDQIADMLMFFIPGIASQLKDLCLSDEKIGHKVPMTALKAWSRIVTLQMQDYNACDNKMLINNEKQDKKLKIKQKWKDENEFKEYLQQSKRTPEWYKETDKNLCKIIIELTKLTHHSHEKIRLELANTIDLLINNCIETMPNSIQQLIVIAIILSEDSNDLVKDKCRTVLEELSNKLTSDKFRHLVDNLEEGFYNAIISLPRKFNSVDEGEQLGALNLLLGYINLFRRHNLVSILYSLTYLDQLLSTLIHIAEFDKSDVSSSEDYLTPEFESFTKIQMPWKKFRYFKDDRICMKIEEICCLLGRYGAGPIVGDFLLNKFDRRSEIQKEVTFLLNGLISGLNDEQFVLIKNILTTYVDHSNWYLPLQVMIDDEGYEHTLGDVQSYILEVCLLVEGVGIVALTLKQKFQQFLLTNLYLVIERAGSNHPLIRSAGMLALFNISQACGYQDIQSLINDNLDYFSFYLGRQLRRSQLNENALNVLTTIMKYNSSYVQNATMQLITDFLDKSDKGINSLLHLRLFKTFIKSLHKWLKIEIVIPPLKSKQQKQQEFENFQVTGIDYEQNFSDDIMGKSAEELYKEDMEKNRKQLENEDDFDDKPYEKPKPPPVIELTSKILKECLNTLPSKDRNKKLLTLEILKDGIEILKDWEDELLPIVHLIWGPLVDRFKETDHLVINHSFQLLVTLARLSQQFIRLRTTREVLPQLLKLLDELSQQSYLKDRGATYRFTQSYKLQVVLLEHLARLIADLDMLDEHVQKIVTVIFKYLSDKQPLPLQTAALDFFKILQFYDPTIINDKKMQQWLIDNQNNEFSKNLRALDKCEH